MLDKEMKIEKLTLRIPGEYENDAKEIGQDVAQLVAESLPSSFQNRQLDIMNLKLTISHGMSRIEITKLIANEILKGLI